MTADDADVVENMLGRLHWHQGLRIFFKENAPLFTCLLHGVVNQSLYSSQWRS